MPRPFQNSFRKWNRTKIDEMTKEQRAKMRFLNFKSLLLRPYLSELAQIFWVAALSYNNYVVKRI